MQLLDVLVPLFHPALRNGYQTHVGIHHDLALTLTQLAVCNAAPACAGTTRIGSGPRYILATQRP